MSTSPGQRDPARLDLVWPADLPITAWHDELLAAVRDHQVVVVAGETGSGKSTQLPKLALELGRGTDRLIGHTQPRRVAARAIAERLAAEVGSELGDAVGYTVRFTDTVGPQTFVRVMTDGILLAEIQRDRRLSRYDTLIIDEAHERSLNIDFLLGYLRRLLPQRRDLKVIITSATIDTARIAAHFATDGVPAPVVEVSGRAYPVDIRYRPIEEGGDQVQAVVDAVDELEGDVLAFFSGEREIHDAADALRRHAADRGRPLEVLPLYSRLSAAEQHRIFEPHRTRRVVLSTNIAETSLTVPGIRAVVDVGTARISRYSTRSKVQRLPIEPVSQASADQRAGRCGRLGPGVCIRLYAEDDYATRPRFTEPEILRTNLASVILQMTALGLGDIADFPFLDPPDPRAVRAGYALLEELGALTPGTQTLTTIGRRLARLPVDPRLGRMVLEADRLDCVREVIIIAAALSIQDPRERPAEQRAAADELHRRFVVEGSDFLTFVRLWDHLRAQQQELSGTRFRRMCRDEFLHYLRVREWQDVVGQLRSVAADLGIHGGTETAHPDRVHQAILAGMLSHLGMRDTATRDYRGAQGTRFTLAGGTAVAGAPPRWVVAAELVGTDRVRARVVAAIRPEWAERIAPHLVRRSHGDPWWDPQRGGAVCREQVMLYGLPIATRTIGYERIDAAAARAEFIRCALVDGDWTTRHAVLERNRALLDELAATWERSRQAAPIDDDTVAAFYEARLGASVVNGREFDRWWRATRDRDPDLLTMTPEKLAPDAAPDPHAFPTRWQIGERALAVSYRFEPGADDDGATVHVPLAVLPSLDEADFDWHVPGYRDELVTTLLRSLPKEYRRDLVPMNDVIEQVKQLTSTPVGPLGFAMSNAVARAARVDVPAREFRLEFLPPHLRVRFAVTDDSGTVVAAGRDLPALRARLAGQVRRAVARAVPLDERRGITTWDLGVLPRVVTADGPTPVRGYPALLDDGDSVSLRILADPDLQERAMHGGIRRLLLLGCPVRTRILHQHLDEPARNAIRAAGLTLDALGDECLTAAADRIVSMHTRRHGTVQSGDDFAVVAATARRELADAASRAMATAAEICAAAVGVRGRLERLVSPSVAVAAADADAHLGRLVRRGFVTTAGIDRLSDVLRYVRAIDHRLTKVVEDPARDGRLLADVVALEADYRRLLARHDRAVPVGLVDLGWMLEELRVAVFAQSLGAVKGTSVSRVREMIAAAGDPTSDR
ncbi:MAG: ATP-dependent RNA helicase HrpA [Ilumatobacteraceae bacterium]